MLHILLLFVKFSKSLKNIVAQNHTDGSFSIYMSLSFGGRLKFAPDGVSGKLDERFRKMFQRLFFRVASKLALTSALQVSSFILMAIL